MRPFNGSNVDEIKRVFQIQQRAYSVEAKILETDSFFPLQETLEEFRITTDEGYVAIFDSKIVGALFLEKSKESILISKLVIDPNFFRKGCAKALIENVLNLYPNLEFQVGTGAANTPAIQLYQKFGFEIFKQELVDGNLKVVKLRKSL